MELLSKLKASEPVRLYLYPILVILIGYGVYRGVVDDSVATLVVIPALGVLLGIPATEAARAKVTPQAKLPDVVADGANVVVDRARQEIRDRFGDQGAEVLDVVTHTIDDYVGGRHRRAE
ncbi:hypothetical protein QSJ19_00950 [Gordonia sp. ABSL11-1]|uniref:hypothetical protein n=1 Tax=Gordonia sp. ABSL11-1 TaxID=3053924 RepID=UPI002573CF88|nr:hypothetical protein [Gordonia sp. ABSL11-1]MDL9944169.1 hypothetical protein [Gordonia sp. ABSL11-1]